MLSSPLRILSDPSDHGRSREVSNPGTPEDGTVTVTGPRNEDKSLCFYNGLENFIIMIIFSRGGGGAGFEQEVGKIPFLYTKRFMNE